MRTHRQGPATGLGGIWGTGSCSHGTWVIWGKRRWQQSLWSAGQGRAAVLTAWRSSSSPPPKSTAPGAHPPAWLCTSFPACGKLVNFQLEGTLCSTKSGSELLQLRVPPCAARWDLWRGSGDRTGQKEPREQEAGRRASLSEANPSHTTRGCSSCPLPGAGDTPSPVNQ